MGSCTTSSYTVISLLYAHCSKILPCSLHLPPTQCLCHTICVIITLVFYVFFTIRLMFGTTQLYVFIDHTKFKPGQLPDYEDAMEEMVKSAGFDTETDNKTPGILNIC